MKRNKKRYENISDADKVEELKLRVKRLEWFAIFVVIYLVFKPSIPNFWDKIESERVESFQPFQSKDISGASLKIKNARKEEHIDSMEEVQPTKSERSVSSTNRNNLSKIMPNYHGKKSFQKMKMRNHNDFETYMHGKLLPAIQFNDHDIQELEKGDRKLLTTTNATDNETIPECDGTLFQLDLSLDLVPWDTSWELIDVNKNMSVVNVSYAGVGMEERSTKKTYTECLELDTTYKFTIFDSFAKGVHKNYGNGILCGNENGCYHIYLNNELVIAGSSSFGGGESHFFDTTSMCPAGSTLDLRTSNNLDPSSIIWQVHNVLSSTTISVTPNADTTCLSPGLYSLRILDTKNMTLSCGDDDTCFQVLINNEVVFDQDIVLHESLYSFSILNDGSSIYCNEKNMFYMNLRLDRYPDETSFQLINKDTSSTEVHHLYTKSDMFTTDHFATCVDGGNYEFVLHDAYGDGLVCSEAAFPIGCYDMYLNDKIMIQGPPFQKNLVSHVFRPYSECPASNTFLLRTSLGGGPTWQLLESSSSTEIQLSSQNQINEKGSYVACLEPGHYNFIVSNYNENEEGSSEIFVNDRLLVSEHSLSQVDFTLAFLIAIDGTAREQRCASNPILYPSQPSNPDFYDNTIAQVLQIIQLLSSPVVLQDTDSPQYRAACFILFDDIQETPEKVSFLIERYAMNVFHFATSQESEIIKSCAYGDFSATCNENGYIKEIRLRFKGIEGTLPSELGHLSHLEWLDFGGNNLLGTIPTELCRLDLNYLGLWGNQMTGTIPSEIGNWKNMKLLYLFGNNFEGTIPTGVGNLSNLLHFWIQDNEMTGTIPYEIYSCVQLSMLYLNNNRLSGSISTSIGNLEGLQRFFLSNNKLSGSIPSEIGRLEKMENLLLNDNLLSGSIPPQLSQLNNLLWLTLNHNDLTGVIPDIFHNFPYLFGLYLDNNELIGSIPSSMSNLTSIGSLNLEKNRITGTISDSICEKVPAKFLKIDDSKWYADAPKVHCPCRGKRGDIYMWDISKPNADNIPCPDRNIYEFSYYAEYWVEDITAQTSISYVSDTMFEDTMRLCLSPTGYYNIGFYTDLQSENLQIPSYVNMSYSERTNGLVEQRSSDGVNVCGTTFEADDPKRPALNHITQVAAPNWYDTNSSHFDALCWILAKDELLDEYEISDGSLLQRFVMSLVFSRSPKLTPHLNNRDLASTHTCSWPGVYCDKNQKFVVELNLSNQDLMGAVPTEIALLRNLRSIDFSGNNLISTIDAEIYTALPNLDTLDLSQNELTGNIPSEFLNIPSMKQINLAQNQFVGTLSNDVTYSEHLEMLNVGDNLLQGTIPPNILQLDKLKELDFSRNNFNGKIPEGWENLKLIEKIDFAQNRLTGSIPWTMLTSENIEHLMLQSNILTGSIPIEIGTLQKAKTIALNDNALKGSIPKEFEKLVHLNRLHLQNNQLTGEAPDVTCSLTYITDCGDPSFALLSPITCEACTMCCNSHGFCQETQNLKMSWYLIGLAASVLVILLVFKCVKLPDIDITHIYNEDSVYCFVLTENSSAWLIYVVTAAIQVFLYSIFLQASRLGSEVTDWSFTFRCPGNDLDCENESTRGKFGWVLFAVVLFSFLGKDLIKCFFQLRMAVLGGHFKLFISGSTLYFLTVLAAFTSIVYNFALATTNTDLIMNVVILLFISDLDERILEMLEALAPQWTSQRKEDVQVFMQSTTNKNNINSSATGATPTQPTYSSTGRNQPISTAPVKKGSAGAISNIPAVNASSNVQSKAGTPCNKSSVTSTSADSSAVPCSSTPGKKETSAVSVMSGSPIVVSNIPAANPTSNIQSQAPSSAVSSVPHSSIVAANPNSIASTNISVLPVKRDNINVTPSKK